MRLRQSSRSSFAARLVEPTRSQNMTVTGRRSAKSADDAVGAGLVGFDAVSAGPRPAIALDQVDGVARETPTVSLSPNRRSPRISEPKGTLDQLRPAARLHDDLNQTGTSIFHRAFEPGRKFFN